MNYLWIPVLLSIVSSSLQLLCENRTITFTKSWTRFVLRSDDDDVVPMICRYEFQVPQYYIPLLNTAVNLQGNNTITVRQHADCARNFTKTLTASDYFHLAPHTFYIDIDITDKNSSDNFDIGMLMEEPVPDKGRTFEVTDGLATIIDEKILPRWTMIPQAYQKDNLIIRVWKHGDYEHTYKLIHIYDGDRYKGSVYDLDSEKCRGSNFTIVNTNSHYGYEPIYPHRFTILISGQYGWDDIKSVTLSTPPADNGTQEFSSTDGLRVFHDIGKPIDKYYQIGYSFISDFYFKGNGSLDIYAGCATAPLDGLRIARIDATSTNSYPGLKIYGRCLTYVLSDGDFSWSRSSSDNAIVHHIGSKGVIMSPEFPFKNNRTSYWNEYTIDVNDTKFAVTYEIASIGGCAEVRIDGAVFTKADMGTIFTSVSDENQQQVTYTVPTGSEGVLVRYTVVSSSAMALGYFMSILIVFMLLK